MPLFWCTERQQFNPESSSRSNSRKAIYFDLIWENEGTKKKKKNKRKKQSTANGDRGTSGHTHTHTVCAWQTVDEEMRRWRWEDGKMARKSGKFEKVAILSLFMPVHTFAQWCVRVNRIGHKQDGQSGRVKPEAPNKNTHRHFVFIGTACKCIGTTIRSISRCGGKGKVGLCQV